MFRLSPSRWGRRGAMKIHINIHTNVYIYIGMNAHSCIYNHMLLAFIIYLCW